MSYYYIPTRSLVCGGGGGALGGGGFKVGASPCLLYIFCASAVLLPLDSHDRMAAG